MNVTTRQMYESKKFEVFIKQISKFSNVLNIELT